MNITPVYKIKFSDFQYFFFALFVFCSYIQFPFTKFASLIVPCFLCFLLYNLDVIFKGFKKDSFLMYALYGIHLGLCIFFSAFGDAELSNVIRFLLILIMLPLCFSFDCEEEKKKRLYKIFIYLTYVKVFSLIVIYIVYLRVLDYAPFRIYASLHSGDIYSVHSKYLLRIQVPGNALVIDAFLIDLLLKKKLTKRNIYLGIGVLLCGNFAFIMGAFFMIIYIYISRTFSKRKNVNKIPIYIFLLLIALFSIAPYFLNTMEEKSHGSNELRNEQIPYLLSENIITGNGLGNIVHGRTVRRNYEVMSRNGYFEFQSLYIINQIGFLGYFIFIILTFYLVYYRQKKLEYIVCYFIYLLYAFFNPYCFDTTHMLFGLLLAIPISKVSNEVGGIKR